MKMTHTRPTVPGWYWATIPDAVPLQPVFVFDSGDGLGLLYTLERIREDDDGLEINGNILGSAHKSWLWSDEPISMPEGAQ